MKDWTDQKVIIIGAARQGTALAGYLARHGAQVVLNDSRPAEALEAARLSLADAAGPGTIAWVCGGHPLDLLDGADLVCPSGGVPLTLPLVQAARGRGIPLSNDSQIFLEAAPCPVVGITGSAGKTTTTTLVGRMAEAAVRNGTGARSEPRKSWLGGNIGTPLISMVDEMQADDLAVMELSSFQLELMTRSPQVAAMLNITPNHLDRHGTMAAYTAAKAHILLHQSPGDTAVLGRDDPGAWALAPKVDGRLLSFGLTELSAGQEGTFLRGDTLYLRSQRPGDPRPMDVPLLRRDSILLRGEHNLLNVLAACAIAAAAGLPVEAMQQAVAGFRGVAHRLEFVRTWGGADWYNDSIATAPERTLAAIHSFDERGGGPSLVLLAGGRDKNLPWEDFAEVSRRRVEHLILFGEAAEKINQAMQAALQQGGTVQIHRAENLRSAVETAARVVRPGSVVLLSPGGTSFDEFQDFEERGACFARLVNELP